MQGRKSQGRETPRSEPHRVVLQGNQFLKSANLDLANFKDADFGRVNFEGARVRGVIFKEANLRDANSKNVELAGVI